jgi:hypothetical protein
MVLLLHVASLKNKRDVGASTGLRWVLEKCVTCETKKIWSLKVHDDITCFSNRCCDVVGHLVETALWPWSFAWKLLGGRVSPDARVTLSRKIPGRFTGNCTIV